MFTRIKERARRSVAALTAAALLAGTAVLGLAAPAAAVNDVVPAFTEIAAPTSTVGTVTWQVSSQSWQRIPERKVTGGAEVTSSAITFPVTAVTGTAGSQVLTIAGKLRSSFVNGGAELYFFELLNLRAVQTGNASWELLGTVNSGVPNTESPYQSFDNVLIGSFTSTGVAPGASVQSSAQQFADLKSVLPASMQAHFNESTEAKKMAPVTIALDEPAPVDFDVTVTGSGFTDLPNASSGDAASGVYVAVVEAGTDITAITSANALKATYLPNVAIRGGAFTTKLTVPAAHAGKSLEVVSWSAHGNANAATLIDRKPVTSSNTVALAYVKDEPAPVDFDVTVTGSGFTDLPNASSGDAASGVYVAVVEAGTDITAITAANALKATYLPNVAIRGGAFTTKLTVPAAHAGKSLEVVSWSAHGNANAATLIDRKPVTSSNTVALAYVKEEPAPVDFDVTVTGSGFTDLPNASSGDAASGVYVAVVEAGTDITAITAANALKATYLPNVAIRGGAFTTKLTVPAAHAGKSLEVVSWSAHGNANAATLIDRKPVTSSNTVALKHTKKEETKPPVTPEVPEAPVAQAGSLQWGVKKSFRDYLQTPLAHGAVTLVGAAQNADGSVYAFPQSSSDFAGTTGTVRYSGSVRFTGHDGDLDTTLDKPYVVVTGKTTGDLYATVSAKHMTDSSKAVSKKVLKVANLTFGTPVANADGSYTFKTTKVILAAAGVAAFSDFYPAGEVLDNLTFIAGSNSTQGGGATGSTDGFTAAVSDSTVTPGQRVTLTGRGFAPNATGISAYMYSTPVLLAQNLKADAQGVVTTKVTIPANTPAGKHTLSLELGTQKAQVTITVAAANTGGVLPTLVGGTDSTDAETPAQEETVTEPVCVARAVSGASLNWGLRSSYVRYVDNLSDGVVSATGSVRRAGSTFAWSGGSGKYNVDANKGLVYFGGKLHFAGHDDAMNSTFSNVRIQFASSTTAYVLADVVAKGLDSAGLTKNGAHIATVSLAGSKSASGSKITWSNAPVTLTSTGAAAFGGFYEAGESLDSMTISVPLGATTDCDAGSGTLAATGADSGTSTAALAAVAMMFAGLALVAVRRVRGGAATR